MLDEFPEFPLICGQAAPLQRLGLRERNEADLSMREAVSTIQRLFTGNDHRAAGDLCRFSLFITI
jgi:hypothetical protein